DPIKLRHLIEDHHAAPPVLSRKHVRLEAENFRYLEGYALEDRNDKKASHRLEVKLTSKNSGSIRTRFDEPFAGPAAHRDVEVRYCDEKGSQCSFALFVNGVAQGAAWESPGEGRGWASQVIRDVAIKA